mgnify:CR=1 FL=1
MYISEKSHPLKDHPTSTKSKKKGPKTIKINKKKTEEAFLKLDIQIKHSATKKSSNKKSSKKKSTKKSSKKYKKKLSKKSR